MDKYIINGGKTLSGELAVSGSKNAVLPLMFACIAVEGVSEISGVPDIGDVRVAEELITALGAKIHREGDSLIIDTRELSYTELDSDSVAKIRASSYLMGACLARFGRAHLYTTGGCKFSSRPIDMHIDAFCALGAAVIDGEIRAKELIGAEIHFQKTSVGATINAIIAASAARGLSRIYGYAREPHVISLISFMKSSGVPICLTDEYIELVGAKTHGATHTVIRDMIEAGTYIAVSLLTESPFLIKGIDMRELASFSSVLEYAGAKFSVSERGVCVHGKIKRPFRVITAPYPAYPTDLQPLAAPLMAREGGIITEKVWHGRFAYLAELSAMGLMYELDGDSAVIYKSALSPSAVTATDLRGGAALLAAALSADGETSISSASLIDRGYENIEEKLRMIGADIKRTT